MPLTHVIVLQIDLFDVLVTSPSGLGDVVESSKWGF